MNAPLQIYAILFRKLCFQCSWRLQNEQWHIVTRKMFSLLVVYYVDNGAMIAYTGLLAYANETSTPLEESTFTQWFRTDEVLATWREKKESSNGLMEKRGMQI
ncbi:unnamed protein product [Camellia sinensis]